MRKITPVATVTGTAAAALKLPLDKLLGNAEPGQNGLAWQPGLDRNRVADVLFHHSESGGYCP